MRFYLLLALLLLSACAPAPAGFNSSELRIYQVVDGDTFIVSSGEYVRLIGVDAPERGEEGYHEATDFMREFEGSSVVLESEGSDRDRYGRLLRHAYVGNSSLARLLLESSHATIYNDYNGTQRSEFEKFV